MTSPRAIATAYLLDWLAGDPEWLPHPVRLIGRATHRGETRLRRPGQSAMTELAAGGGLACGVVGLAYVGTAACLRAAERLDNRAGATLASLLGWTCLATRNLLDESRPVIDAVERSDIAEAREQLARIVGRDTKMLGEAEILRAVIETLAESACDGIVAPLFYMALGGVPLAMAYKAVNTLDSMIGHTDQRYYYFGKVAARLDDVANYLPARITALMMVFAAGDTSRSTAWHTWRRDSQKHKSPNAGNPESAMAGALEVRLGGENTYAGERVATALLGAEFPPPVIASARRAIRITVRVSLVAAVVALVVRHLRKQ